MNMISMKIFRAEPSHWYRCGDDQIGLIDSLFVGRRKQRPDFNRRMFDEDFARIFLWRSTKKRNLFEIVSNDDELMQKLLGKIETRYARRSVDEKICELIEEIARSLIWFGRSFYFLYDDFKKEEINLASFSSRGVMRLFRTHIQWVPKRRERSWDRDDEELSREIRILDASKVMRFDMPKSIKRMLAAQNGTLAIIDKHQFEAAKFHPQATHENPNPNNHFDFQVWNMTQERAFYRATRETGWNGRKYDSSRRSDFFDCHRLIRFRRNQILLRDDIMSQLSGELSRLGRRYKSNFAVAISGTDELMSTVRLNDLEERLTREEVGFSEIIDYCYNS